MEQSVAVFESNANPMEPQPKQLSPKLAILKYTHQRKIEKPSGVIYIHHPMLPAKFYCFNIAKTNASISLELVKNAPGRVRELNNIHSVGSE